eukprot:m.5504 g.5504  ORF g.5504 m.5504 type:complete len:323 (-) comp2010_c0_seq1:130-1098(-)
MHSVQSLRRRGRRCGCAALCRRVLAFCRCAPAGCRRVPTDAEDARHPDIALTGAVLSKQVAGPLRQGREAQVHLSPGLEDILELDIAAAEGKDALRIGAGLVAVPQQARERLQEDLDLHIAVEDVRSENDIKRLLCAVPRDECIQARAGTPEQLVAGILRGVHAVFRHVFRCHCDGFAVAVGEDDVGCTELAGKDAEQAQPAAQLDRALPGHVVRLQRDQVREEEASVPRGHASARQCERTVAVVLQPAYRHSVWAIGARVAHTVIVWADRELFLAWQGSARRNGCRGLGIARGSRGSSRGSRCSLQLCVVGCSDGTLREVE